MKKEKELYDRLLCVLPIWHTKIVRPFRDALLQEMSLETFYCLQILKLYGPMRMKALASAMNLPKQSLTKLMKHLEAYEFVERSKDPIDQRSVQISISEKALLYMKEHFYETNFLDSFAEIYTDLQLQALLDACETLQQLLPKLEIKENKK